MTNYNELSDFEINKRVAELRHEKLITNNPSKPWCSDPDYCNNWNAAGPIIVDCKMDIISPVDDLGEEYNRETWLAEIWSLDQAAWFTAEHDNPLRAAMIVYLMMKEADNE